MLRTSAAFFLFIALIYVQSALRASDMDDAIALKNEAMEIFRANAGKAVAPEMYAQGIRKLERAETLLESAAKVDPEGAAPLQREVASARFWAQRFANVKVAEALRGDKSKPTDDSKTPTPPVKTEAPTAEVEPAQHKTAAESAIGVAESVDKSAAQLMKDGKQAEAAAKLLQALMSKAGTNPNKIAELGDYFFSLGRFPVALDYYKQLVKESEKRLGADDAFLALDLNKLADTYFQLGNYAQVEPLYRRILSIRQKVYGQEHADVAQTLLDIGECNTVMCKFDQAEMWLKRGTAMKEKLFKADAPELAGSHLAMGWLYQSRCKFALAEAEYRKALEISERAYGVDDSRIVPSLSSLASFLMSAVSKFDEADILLNRALPIVEKASGPEHLNTARILFKLGALAYFRDSSDTTKCEEHYTKALAIQEKSVGLESKEVAITLKNLSAVMLRSKDYKRAEELILRSQSIFLKIGGPINPDVADSYLNISALYYDQKKYADAETMAQRALSLYKQLFGLEHINTIRALLNLSISISAQGKYPQGVEILAQTVLLAEKILPQENPLFALMLNNYAATLRKMKRIAEADKIEARAKSLPGNEQK